MDIRQINDTFLDHWNDGSAYVVMSSETARLIFDEYDKVGYLDGLTKITYNKKFIFYGNHHVVIDDNLAFGEFIFEPLQQTYKIERIVHNGRFAERGTPIDDAIIGNTVTIDRHSIEKFHSIRLPLNPKQYIETSEVLDVLFGKETKCVVIETMDRIYELMPVED